MAVVRFRTENGIEWTREVPGPGLDQRTFDSWVERGRIVVLDPAVGATVPQAPGPGVSAGALTMPGRGASKAAWVDWAVTQGADRAEAEGRRKVDLVAAYGQPAEDGT